MEGTGSAFLEIELAARRGRRSPDLRRPAPNDDVMDTVFTLLVNAGNGLVIRHGIDRPTMLASRQFPYLASRTRSPEAPHT